MSTSPSRRRLSPPSNPATIVATLDLADPNQCAAHELFRRFCAVRDHLRKLFLGHLRLGPLSLQEVSDLVARYTATSQQMPRPVKVGIAGTSGQQTGESGQDATKDEVKLATAKTDERTLHDDVAAAQDVEPALNKLPKIIRRELVIFTALETEILTKYAQRILGTAEAPRIGPRTIRSYIFRYQLARLLLRALNIEPDPEAIAEYLYEFTDTEDGRALEWPERHTLEINAQRVLEQVREATIRPEQSSRSAPAI